MISFSSKIIFNSFIPKTNFNFFNFIMPFIITNCDYRVYCALSIISVNQCFLCSLKNYNMYLISFEIVLTQKDKEAN